MRKNNKKINNANNNSLKRNYVIRYSSYWGDLLCRTALPFGIVAWKFGIFKTETGLTSHFRGWVIVAVIIIAFILRKDLTDKLKQIENKGWFKSVKTATVWIIIFLTLIMTHKFISEMLWVVGAFTIGSLQAIITEPIHTKQVNIIKEHKELEKKIMEQKLLKEVGAL